MVEETPFVGKTVRDIVLGAFRRSKAAKVDPMGCYRAATDAWSRLYPQHSRAEAAGHVVSLIHDELGPVREVARKLFDRP